MTEMLNYLAKVGEDNRLSFITERLKFDSNKPYDNLPEKISYDTKPYPKGVFSDREVSILLDIGKDYFRVLAKDSKNPVMIELNSILERIMTQDWATMEEGFDIQECLDYFTTFLDNEEDKIKLAEEIIARW